MRAFSSPLPSSSFSASPGYLLQLDFRDEFHLEPSDDCRFDYLEVRDGAHGFSKQLGLFCGHTHPPMITSSDRFLWLRFHSDENVEYSGFRAVYTNRVNPAEGSGWRKQLDSLETNTKKGRKE
ncbi:hypothetical protein J437_LFUL011541 [Ladona fulva]|uniref:CUB domain-containing protein n=1 Tax=Ladona fulva TaxID=123851 RepID=A0A8K0KBU0_LADFU|nr:hypothetical protein J437_LFUL011541 [Ladona fulva]